MSSIYEHISSVYDSENVSPFQTLVPKFSRQNSLQIILIIFADRQSPSTVELFNKEYLRGTDYYFLIIWASPPSFGEIYTTQKYAYSSKYVFFFVFFKPKMVDKFKETHTDKQVNLRTDLRLCTGLTDRPAVLCTQRKQFRDHFIAHCCVPGGGEAKRSEKLPREEVAAEWIS